MNQPPLISAVLANYNGARYLRECIESVLAQDFDDFEFIIVDDGSTDGSRELIQECVAGRSDRVRVLLLEKNSGQGEAFNRGVALARGRLVSFIDSDDLWFPHKLSIVARDFGDPEAIAFHQHNLSLLRGGSVTGEAFRSVFSVGDLVGDMRRSKALPNFIATTGLTFSRRALGRVLPIPAAFRICADGFLTRTAVCFGRISASDACLGAYRVHESNATFANPGFNHRRYIQELLIPNLNAFYETHGIALSYLTEPPVRPRLEVLHLGASDRVLMFRSAPVDRVLSVLGALFEAFPDVGVDLLVQPGFEASFADPRIRIGPLPAGVLPAALLPQETRRFIAAGRHTCCLIPYNEPDGGGYENLHASLRLSEVPGPWLGIGTRGALFPIAP